MVSRNSGIPAISNIPTAVFYTESSSDSPLGCDQMYSGLYVLYSCTPASGFISTAVNNGGNCY